MHGYKDHCAGLVSFLLGNCIRVLHNSLGISRSSGRAKVTMQKKTKAAARSPSRRLGRAKQYAAIIADVEAVAVTVSGISALEITE